MGVIYNMYCHDCRVKYDLDKLYNAKLLLFPIAKTHEGHAMEVISDAADCEEPDYREIDIWKCENRMGFQAQKYKEPEFVEDLLNGRLFTCEQWELKKKDGESWYSKHLWRY